MKALSHVHMQIVEEFSIPNETLSIISEDIMQEANHIFAVIHNVEKASYVRLIWQFISEFILEKSHSFANIPVVEKDGIKRVP